MRAQLNLDKKIQLRTHLVRRPETAARRRTAQKLHLQVLRAVFDQSREGQRAVVHGNHARPHRFAAVIRQRMRRRHEPHRHAERRERQHRNDVAALHRLISREAS